MFGVLLIGPADILCDVKAERVVAQICEKIRDFDEASHSDVKMLTESLRGLPTNVRIHVSLAKAKKLTRPSTGSKTKTDPPRHLRLPVWTRSRSSVSYESLPSANLFARQLRRMLRPLTRWHLLGNSLVRRFGISGRQD
jgi:hypothetical protein